MSSCIVTADYIEKQQIGEDVTVIWNRFHPAILELDNRAVEFLHNIGKGKPISVEENKSYIDLLRQHKILYLNEPDSSREEFVLSVNREFKKIKDYGNEFYQNRGHYQTLSFINDDCNLKCSYCVRKHKNTIPTSKTKQKDRIEAINRCIEQFFQRSIDNRVEQIHIGFNGGEILLDWPLIKWIVETISRDYGDLDVRYYLNTNMTIMSEEIARFFEKHRFDVDISIDGYPGAHDKTRRYYNGKGSFENIIKNLAILRENYKTLQLKAFQGTIDRTDDFECEEVYQMKRYGFTSARLAPNLLYISEEEAIKKARIMGKFLDLNARHDFKVGDGYFDNMKNLINLPQYAFFFNCFGLTGFPKVGLYFNISNLRISQLCNFISRTSVPFKDVDEDIYNPEIWQISSRFIQNRVDTLLKTCMECELVGICRGGCIVNGLDKNNQINKAACAYQKELWKIFLKKIVDLSSQKPDSN